MNNHTPPATKPIILYDYWRSSASYRVRIALNLKKIDYQIVTVNLLQQQEQSTEHRKRNPQGLVPVLAIDGEHLTQSLAIIDYLEQRFPANSTTPALIDDNPLQRSRLLSLAHIIAMEIHPICNLQVVNHLSQLVGNDDCKISWMQHYIRNGLQAYEQQLHNFSKKPSPPFPFSISNTPTIADCCLIPQLYNAERWGVDISDLKHIKQIQQTAQQHPAFIAAYPTSTQ